MTSSVAPTTMDLEKQFPDLLWQDLIPPEKHPMWQYEGHSPGKITHFPKGHVQKPGYQAFRVDVTLEQDVAVSLRDQTKIYINVYRPSEAAKRPALIAWSPYGKCAGGQSPQNYDDIGPARIGIPYQNLTGLERFEGPNPADWCQRGYNVIDPDARGACHSEGNVVCWGMQEAEDVYDLIDWTSKQDWCDGTVVMFGNSWLAIAQINVASRAPHPALKAIAPWEALTDPYNHQACRGGVPANPDFGKMILFGNAGYNKMENLWGMLDRRPVFDDYWESKAIPVEKIRIPMYLTASYSTRLHSPGSFDTYTHGGSPQRWLRVHPTQEWNDLYKEKNMDELQRFYDYFAKGETDNGWMETPRLRLSLLGFDCSSARTIVERPEDGLFPLSRTRVNKYYLDASTHSMSQSPPSDLATVSHEGHHLTDASVFKLHFLTYTELSGKPWVKLYMSCPSHTDLDVNVQLRKLDYQGNMLEHANYPMPIPITKIPNTNVAKHLGPTGVLRASHAVTLVPKRDPDDYPVYTHRSRSPIEPAGSVVALEIPIWPIGMVFEAGEGIALVVSGHEMVLPEVGGPLKEPVDANKGTHVVHTGGECESFLMLPFI